MFTGIIKEIGKISEVAKKSGKFSITIDSKKVIKGKKKGQSIAVNGACLTINKIKTNKATFEVMEETLRVTNLKYIKKGSKVNLEPAIKAGEDLDGHMVQGHVDCTAKILKAEKEKLEIEIPKNSSKYLALKGSIAINGVSLTISHVEEKSFEVCLIEHTLKNTNLSELKKGDEVNIEFDPLAKYIEKLLDSKADETKYEFLLERGFI